MHADPRRGRLGAFVLALLSLAIPGCGFAAALLAGVITDAINGNNDDGGDPTVLIVINDAASTESIVLIEAARADGAQAPYSYVVDTPPNTGKALKNIFDPGIHWVRVVYASGWRSRAQSINVVKDSTVSMTFPHGPPALATMGGTWFGATETLLGISGTYALTLDAAGHADARTIDGVVDAATGALTETSDGVFQVAWSDATITVLVTDFAQGHAGFLDDDGTVGALEKGATSLLPIGADADVVGSWTGTGARFTGAALAPSALDSARAVVSAQQHWEGSAGFAGVTLGVSPLIATVPAFLRFACDVEDEGGSGFSLDMWLTPDRTFGFVRRTPAVGGQFPDVDTFEILTKGP